MTTMVTWLIVGLYCAMVLATWCAGAFGIGASANDARKRAVEISRRKWYGSDQYAGFHFVKALLGMAALTAVAGVIWPIAIPLYLAYRKGIYVDDALTKRNALLSKDDQR